MQQAEPGDSIEELLRARTSERDGLIDRLKNVLAADVRVRAAWLFGSVGRGAGDGFSDLDVAVVVADDEFGRVAGGPEHPATYDAVQSSSRARFGAAVAEPMLVLEAPQNAPCGGAFLSTFVPGVHGPHGIDWVWQPRSVARMPSDVRLLIDRRSESSPAEPGPGVIEEIRDGATTSPVEAAVRATCSFWAMLLWSVKGVARQPEAPQLPLLRHADRCLRRIDEITGAHSVTIPAGRSSGGLDKLRRLRAYAELMEQRTAGLQAAGVVLPAQIPDQVKRLLDVATEVVRAGSPMPRRGR